MGTDTSGPGGTAPEAPARPPGGNDDRLVSLPGRSPVLDAAQLGVLRRYGSERDVAAGDVLFVDGDETYDLIVLLAGTADIVEGYGRPGASVVASYGPSEFLGEIGMLTEVKRPGCTILVRMSARICDDHSPSLRSANGEM